MSEFKTDRNGYYIVQIKSRSTMSWPDDVIYPWLEENFPGKYRFYINSISFVNLEDAVAFKLFWGELHESREY